MAYPTKQEADEWGKKLADILGREFHSTVRYVQNGFYLVLEIDGELLAYAAGDINGLDFMEKYNMLDRYAHKMCAIAPESYEKVLTMNDTCV